MADRLFVAVLGHRNSGKSRTWNDLFGRTVRTGTGSRYLELKPNECVEVFLISGSPQERGEYAGDILKNQSARVVLCSVQYIDEARDTFDYILQEQFDVFVQWLNPGHADAFAYFDRLGFLSLLTFNQATISIRDGTKPTGPRIQEIREFVYGWASFRNLIVPCNGS